MAFTKHYMNAKFSGSPHTPGVTMQSCCTKEYSYVSLPQKNQPTATHKSIETVLQNYENLVADRSVTDGR
jgi:hypothetical protein